MPWLITDTKFTKLKALNNEWDLKNHDIMVTCDGTDKFQDLTYTPCKESVWQMRPEFKEVIFKESESLRENLQRELGADLSIDEIKELLGQGVAQPNDVLTNAQDLNDILAEV